VSPKIASKGGYNMSEEMKKATLLVGKTMNLDMRNCRIDLAVNVEELAYKIGCNDNIIIENFDNEEYGALKALLKGAIGAGKHVYFYVPNNEENVTGLADEMGMEVYMYIDEIEKLL
jgi:hypothetical protein